jgi:hypothetical protein
MLDELEYAEIASLFRQGMKSVKEYREKTGASIKEAVLRSNDSRQSFCGTKQ